MLGITWGEESVKPEHQRRNARDAIAAGFPTPVADPDPAAADAPLPDPAACAQSKGIVNQPIRHLFSFSQGPRACRVTQRGLDGMPGALYRSMLRPFNL